MTVCRRASFVAVLGAAILLALTPASRAQGGAPNYVGGLKLVRGSVPLPDFGSRYGLPPAFADGVGVEAPGFTMALTGPDGEGRAYMFSPRMPLLMPEAHGGAGSRAYLGFSFDIGEPTGLYGSLAFGGSVTGGRAPGIDDGGPRTLSAPLLLHSVLEFGYRLDPQSTFALSIDRATLPDPLDRSSAIGNFRLHYGLKF